MTCKCFALGAGPPASLLQRLPALPRPCCWRQQGRPFLPEPRAGLASSLLRGPENGTHRTKCKSGGGGQFSFPKWRPSARPADLCSEPSIRTPPPGVCGPCLLPPHASGQPGFLLGFRCPPAGGSGPQDSRPGLLCPESLYGDRVSLRFCLQTEGPPPSPHLGKGGWGRGVVGLVGEAEKYLLTTFLFYVCVFKNEQ